MFLRSVSPVLISHPPPQIRIFFLCRCHTALINAHSCVAAPSPRQQSKEQTGLLCLFCCVVKAMPRLDHRKLESLISPGGVPALQGDGDDAVRRRRKVAVALAVQWIYIAYTLAFVLYECTISGSLVHTRPPAELFKIVAYSMSCLLVYRSVPMYLRLMLIWTITTAFSGVFQPLLWLDNASDSITEQRLVWTLLALSIAGMAGNILGALTVFPSAGASSGKARRRRYKTQVKES